MTDGELVNLSLAGRDNAFAEIVRRHRARLYRLVARNVGDADEALDLVQEVFVSAHHALGRFDPQRPMLAWLMAIAINKCHDWRRRRTVRRFLSFAMPNAGSLETIAADNPAPDREAIGKQELRYLEAAVAALGPALREPLLLHTVEGFSQAETAAILSISEKAVETRIRRARIQLAESLQRER